MTGQKERRVLRKRRCGMNVFWTLFFCLVVFVGVSLTVAWIFHVRLLNIFYKQFEVKELLTVERAMENTLEDMDNLKDIAMEYADKYGACITVYEVDDGIIRSICDAGVNDGFILRRVSEDRIEEFYRNTVEQGGRNVAEFRLETDGLSPREGRKNAEKNVSAVSMRVAEKNGTRYFIVAEQLLTPVEPVAATVGRQLLWIAVILIALAAVFSFVMSQILAKPLVRMSFAVKRLTRGEREVRFAGSPCQEIRELSDTLDHAANELAGSRSSERQLIADISHDMRTPLTMIKGYGEVMRDIPTEHTPENFQIIIDETERLSELVNDTLDLSRLRAGVRSPIRSEFNLTETVREAMIRYDKLISFDGYTIRFEAEEEVTVYADRAMILQVVYNLINNAVNYTGEDKTVIVTQSVTGENVRVSVADSGDGIGEQDADRIWSRYYRANNTCRRTIVGTGLGLSIVRNILLSHKAVFGLDSRVGAGTVFWFELPIVPKKENAEKRDG